MKLMAAYSSGQKPFVSNFCLVALAVFSHSVAINSLHTISPVVFKSYWIWHLPLKCN